MGSDLVIGSGLRAARFAFDNNYTLVQNLVEPPHRFDFFDPEIFNLPFKLENLSRTLQGCKGTQEVGLPKYFLWERLLFELSMRGDLPLSDKVESIRIKSPSAASVTTRGNKKIDFNFDKVHVMDPRGVTGLEFSDNKSRLPEKRLVLDWFNVRSGCVHDFDFFSGESHFAHTVHFYPSERIAGNHNKKDLVSFSHLTTEELNSPEYSIVPLRYKILNWMKREGVRGQSNGRDPNDPSKKKHYAIKIEHARRQVIHAPEDSNFVGA